MERVWKNGEHKQKTVIPHAQKKKIKRWTQALDQDNGKSASWYALDGDGLQQREAEEAEWQVERFAGLGELEREGVQAAQEQFVGPEERGWQGE